MKKRNEHPVDTATLEKVATWAGRSTRASPSAGKAEGGKPTETAPDWLTPAMRDAMDDIWRKALVRSSKIDFPIAIFNSLQALDALYKAFMRQGELNKAFTVLREKNKLLSLERHVQPRTESDSWDERRDPYFQAVRELDPADLHEAGQRRAKLDQELRRAAYEKTGRNPDGSKKHPTPDLSAHVEARTDGLPEPDA